MRYKRNEVTSKCPKKNCDCKNCMFNGIVGMCAGCLECEDHKLLQPVVNCSLIKEGDWSGFLSVKVLDQYYICIATGSCGIPEYHHISEEEYRTFEIWKNEDKKFYEILNRKSV